MGQLFFTFFCVRVFQFGAMPSTILLSNLLVLYEYTHTVIASPQRKMVY